MVDSKFLRLRVYQHKITIQAIVNILNLVHGTRVSGCESSFVETHIETGTLRKNNHKVLNSKLLWF